MRWFKRALQILCAINVAASVSAQVPSAGVDEFVPPVDARWASITARDVDAAYHFILENDPAAAPEVKDTKFVAALEASHQLARTRARTAKSYDAYVAVLGGFATGLGDKHLWSRPTYVRNLARWPGLIVSLRGNSWVVSDSDDDLRRHALVGARLVSCDDKPIDVIAERALGGFKAAWEVRAQRVQRAPWLLVDESNPYIARPQICRFEHQGREQTVTLSWQRIKREELLPRLAKAGGAGAAGFSVEHFGKGYWIGLQDLDGRADPVVNQVQADQQNLRSADFVVVDVRGNGGGDSGYGRDIAKALMGGAFVEDRLGSEQAPQCGFPEGTYRASRGNYADTVYLARTLQQSADSKRILVAALTRIHDALVHNRHLTGPVSCPSGSSTAAGAHSRVRSLFHGQLVLVTDNLCFSSCLSLVDDFRRLGALQVGQITDQATHYTMVREAYLPSGYSLFSTLMVLDPTSPYQAGPFVPQFAYQGNIAETDALKAWVSEILASKAQ